jgi:hypothetical protein
MILSLDIETLLFVFDLTSYIPYGKYWRYQAPATRIETSVFVGTIKSAQVFALVQCCFNPDSQRHTGQQIKTTGRSKFQG